MTRSSDSLDNLTGDLRHLSTLVQQITNLAMDIIAPDKQQCEQTKKEVTVVTDLLWIARDMVEAIAENSDAVHHKVLAERNAARKGGAA